MLLNLWSLVQRRDDACHRGPALRVKTVATICQTVSARGESQGIDLGSAKFSVSARFPVCYRDVFIEFQHLGLKPLWEVRRDSTDVQCDAHFAGTGEYGLELLTEFDSLCGGKFLPFHRPGEA